MILSLNGVAVFDWCKACRVCVYVGDFLAFDLSLFHLKV